MYFADNPTLKNNWLANVTETKIAQPVFCSNNIADFQLPEQNLAKPIIFSFFIRPEFK